MRKLLITLASAAMVAAAPGLALAENYVKGTVEKIDTKAKKITIAHEELVDLDMPAMTMVFRPADDAMLEALSEGMEIEFVAARIDGKLTVAKIKE